jgi:hypothetical protein
MKMFEMKLLFLVNVYSNKGVLFNLNRFEDFQAFLIFAKYPMIFLRSLYNLELFITRLIRDHINKTF